MAWQNPPIELYHGTDDISATLVINQGIDLSRSNALTDFGRGFYTTTSLHQARNWANNRYRRTLNTSNPATNAAILKFNVDRDDLARRSTLCFVTEGSSQDYWDFITYCRNGGTPHLFQSNSDYDVVFGPVSLWPQTLVLKDCDQVSFHTKVALSVLPTPSVFQRGTPMFP